MVAIRSPLVLVLLLLFAGKLSIMATLVGLTRCGDWWAEVTMGVIGRS